MWTSLTTVESCVQCEPPFSFFFDLVGTHWKSTSSNPITLHRICTLSRKQGASYVVIESALTRADVREEIDFLDNQLGGGGAAEAVTIAFFSCRTNPAENIETVLPSSLLAHVVLINYRAPGITEFTNSYIYEAIVAIPAYRDSNGGINQLLNNFICADSEFRRSVRRREFSLRGIYYAQQNGVTHVCAHACLRMALNSIGVCNPPISSAMINNTLNIVPPFAGLSLGQMQTVIDGIDGVRASIVNCKDLPFSNFLTILAAIVESGHVALLVFRTDDASGESGQQNIDHVVTIFGHTRNSDEWHPEAIPAYSGPPSTPYYPSSFWIDHFLIHDDNLGPYFAFSSRALEFDPKVKATWIVALHPIWPATRPDYAEAAAAALLANLLPSLAPLGSGRWFEMMTRKQLRYVLRTILIERERYLEHLRDSRCHDSTVLSDEEVSLLADLPEMFWMVELSLPQLYAGNRSKLGDVLIDALNAPASDDLSTSLLALRVPSGLVKRANDGTMRWHPLSMRAHSPIFQHRAHTHVW